VKQVRDGNVTIPRYPTGHYGTRFRESDYQRIPSRDLPFGMPAWFGDDACGRKAHASPRQQRRTAA
jgi:hypothetical protein